MLFKKSFLCAIAIFLIIGCSSSSQPPKLTPRQTNFTQTSTYAEVMEVVAYARENAENMHYEVFGHTEQGKALPLLVFSDRVVETPKEAHQLHRPVIFVMANIHGGEVEGKEALLRIILELTAGKHREWLNNVTLLLAPIYNADGNDMISKSHRVNQYGPVGGVGTRANAKGLDLNRDMTKLASAEAQALVHNVLAKWDPALFMDLHTTNGSPHGYHLTYSVPLNPNTDPRIINFQRNIMAPYLQQKMKAKGWNVFPYGNFYEKNPSKGYYTYSPQPRYTTNYIGLRNRLGLLSEAYAYLDFKSRIEVTEDFVKTTINFMAGHADRVLSLISTLNKEYSTFVDTLRAGVSYDYIQNPREFPLLISDLDTVYFEKYDAAMYKRMGMKDTLTSKLYNQFRITATRPVPYAYALDNRAGRYNNIVKNLSLHGINHFVTDLKKKVKVRQFEITDLKRANERYQKRYMNTVEGVFHAQKVSLKGWVIIPTTNINRPLVFQLLEPEAPDGYVAWDMLGDDLTEKPFPIVKVINEIDFKKSK